MTEQKRQAEEIRFNRRSMMKATAATAVGATVFAGTAGATFPEEIRFCGCSQICYQRSGNVARTDVIVACRNDVGDWEYTEVRQNARPGYCYELTDEEMDEPTECKIVAVKVPVETTGGVDPAYYCNPNNCADKALEAAPFTCDVRPDLGPGENEAVVPRPNGRGEIRIRTNQCNEFWNRGNRENGRP